MKAFRQYLSHWRYLSWLRTTWVITGFFFSPFSGAAQPFQLSPPQLFSDQVELTNTRTWSIVQDERGFLWIANQNGLFRFDGSHAQRMRHDYEGISPIENGRINVLFLDEEHQKLWIAHTKGVSVLDLSTEKITDTTFVDPHLNQRLDGECFHIGKDQQSNIWLSFEKTGLVRVSTDVRLFPIQQGEKFASFRESPGISYFVQDPAQDSTLWLATFWGLVRFNSVSGNYTLVDSRRTSTGSPYIVTDLFVTHRRKIYLSNPWIKHFHIYDIDTQTFHHWENHNPDYTLPPFSPFPFLSASDSTVWFLLENEKALGLLHTVKDSLIEVVHAPSYINGLDRPVITSNHLWLPSNAGPLAYQTGPAPVKNYFFPTKKDDIILCMEITGNGILLKLSENEVYRFDLSSHRFTIAPFKCNYRFLPLRSGEFLVGGQEGLARVKGDESVPLHDFDHINWKKEGMESLLEDRNGRIWVGTRWGSLYQLDFVNQTFRSFFQESQYHDFRLLFEDKDHNIWVNHSQGFSVYLIEQDTFFNFFNDPADPMAIGFPLGIEQDYQGKIWISGNTGGLAMVDPQALEKGIQKRLTLRDGSVSNQIWSLRKDLSGRIWMVTDKGLQVMDPVSLTFQNFGESAGFILREETGIYHNLFPSKLHRLQTGEMVLGMRNGLAIFHPDSLYNSQRLPVPYFSSIRADEEELLQAPAFRTLEGPTFPHHQNRLSFEFSSIAYQAPGEIRYAYRLLGLEKDWLISDGRFARYPDLSPGRYRFQLRALNSNGYSQDAMLEYSFRIFPPWWANGWAYSIYLIMLAIGIYTFYQYQKRRWLLQAKLEMEHREAERLKELDAVKTRLYTNITHEFRTPLTVILGMTDRVQNDPENWFREGLKMIRRNGKNLLRLVNQMLDLSKLEAGTLSLHMVQGNIIVYLKYLAESFYSLAEDKAITLQFIADQEEWIMDYDPEKLSQIISNLLSNAIKFTPENGKVTFSVEANLTHGAQNPGHGSLQIKVKDTGPGIPPEHLPHIFDRFYQVDGESSRKQEGAGIGLALTRELVRLFGGEISVTSIPEKGTVFTLLLPVRRTAPPDHFSVAQHPPKKSKRVTTEFAEEEKEILPDNHPLILIIEDNQDVVQYLKACLGDNYQLETARNGRSGMEKALELIPDLIISDVMMPEADGFEVCRTLKNDHRTSHVPIVMLTARADIDSKIEGLGRGADAYLIKPFHREELMVRLHQLIQLRNRLQERYRSMSLPTAAEEEAIQVEDAFIKKVQELMEANLSNENFGVSELCRTLHMSRAQLYRKFDALTGQPVGQYLRSFRLHRARKLLETTDLNISEIAFETGYKDPAYFSRAFKREFGINPIHLRQ